MNSNGTTSDMHSFLRWHVPFYAYPAGPLDWTAGVLVACYLSNAHPPLCASHSPGDAQHPWVPEPYLHRCLCCRHRRFPWTCHSQLLSSPAGRRSATHSGPRCICRCHCTSQGNPLQGKAHGIKVGSSTANWSHTRTLCLSTYKRLSHSSAHWCPQHQGRPIIRTATLPLRQLRLRGGRPY